MVKSPGRGAEEATKARPSRFSRPRPSKFERVSPERFASAEKEIQTLLGANLRQARRRAGLTQTDVANIIHSSQPFVGATERGEQNVRLSTLVRLAYAVRTDPGALLLGDRAKNYSLETLATLVGSLHAHLQAMLGDQSKGLPEGELPTLTAAPKFPFQVEETPETPTRDIKKEKKGFAGK